MMNPWLNIPAADYERHMGSPNVNQLSFLSHIFKESLENYNSDTIALLGCATGNGLEHIKIGSIRRVTVVDINPEYLEILRQRYTDSVSGLEIIQDDLENCSLDKKTYSLIFSGLVFEYLDPRALLRKIVSWLKSKGVMVAVLQLPAKDLTNITDTPYSSLKALNSIMNLIDPKQFKNIADIVGLRKIMEKTITLETGKSFYIGTYQKYT